MPKFDASEVFQFAIEIEENGEKFYRYAAKITKDSDIKDTFNYLADEEVKHKKTFKNILLEIKNYDSIENYPEEYFVYLRTYADNVIFTEEALNIAISKIEDVESAIDFAIGKELDSILYYHEIEILVPENQHTLIDKIINEERIHYLRLTELKKKVGSSELSVEI